MIQKRKEVLIVVVSTLMLSTGSAGAAVPHTGGNAPQDIAGQQGIRREKIYKYLGLSDGQKKMLEENKNKYRQQIKALAQDIRAKRDLLRQGLEKDELDMAGIERLRGELKVLKAQMDDLRFDHILAARKILTVEQFKNFMNQVEKRKRGGRHHKGMGGEDFNPGL